MSGLVISLLLIVLFVSASAPSTPILGPSNNTITIANSVDLTCTASDPEGDTIYYEFWQYNPTLNYTDTEHDLYLHYAFNDDNAYDSTGNGYNGILIGSPSFVEGCGLNGCFDLDGSDDSIFQDGTLEQLDLNGFSISMWFNTSTTSGDFLYGLSESNGQKKSYGFVDSDGKIQFDVRTDGSDFDNVKTDNSYNDGNWHHIVFVKNGTSSDDNLIFIDGTLVARTSQSDTMSTGTFTPTRFRLGDNGYGTVPDHPLRGQIDQVGLYDKILNITKITELYNSGNGISYSDSDILLQNTTSNTYSNYNSEIGWGCKACDNNGECSSKVAYNYINFIDIGFCDNSLTHNIINFTFRDEDYSGNDLLISNFTSNILVEDSITSQTLNAINYSINNISICLSENVNYSATFTNGAIVSNPSLEHTSRKIFLDYLIGTRILNTTNIFDFTMYTTPLADATSVIVRASEEGSALTYSNNGALIYVYRILSATSQYELIAIDDLVQDEEYGGYGKSEFYLKEGQYYKFCIITPDNPNCEIYYINAVTSSDANEFNYDTTATISNTYNLRQNLNLETDCSGRIDSSDFQTCSVRANRVGERFADYGYTAIYMEYNYTYNDSSSVTNKASPLSTTSEELVYNLNSSLINASLNKVVLYFYTDASTNEDTSGATASIYWSSNSVDINNRTIQLGFTKEQIDNNKNLFYFMIITLGLVISLLFNNRIKGSGFVAFSIWALVWAIQGATLMWYIPVLVFMVKMSRLGGDIKK